MDNCFLAHIKCSILLTYLPFDADKDDVNDEKLRNLGNATWSSIKNHELRIEDQIRNHHLNREAIHFLLGMNWEIRVELAPKQSIDRIAADRNYIVIFISAILNGGILITLLAKKLIKEATLILMMMMVLSIWPWNINMFHRSGPETVAETWRGSKKNKKPADGCMLVSLSMMIINILILLNSWGAPPSILSSNHHHHCYYVGFVQCIMFWNWIELREDEPWHENIASACNPILWMMALSCFNPPPSIDYHVSLLNDDQFVIKFKVIDSLIINDQRSICFRSSINGVAISSADSVFELRLQ